MTPPSDLETRFCRTWPPEGWRDVTVVAAVSGGADSVALLRAMAAARQAGQGRLLAAHFNHQLRGEESAADERFVVALCRDLDLACEVGRASQELAIQASDGLEAAARSARYEFLRQTAARLGARYVVTAHTADDQAETILHRILRGTGIAGLAGMARARPLVPGITLLRPLLGFRRAEVLAYLADLGQAYRSDTSNDDLRFTRNRIRHEVLPELAQHVNPGVVDALLRLGVLAGEMQTVVDAAVAELEHRAVRYEPSGAVQINVDPLAGQPRYVIRELWIAVWRRQDWPMQAMGFTEWDLLAEMLFAETEDPAAVSRKRMFPGGVMADGRPGHLRLERREAAG